MGFRALGFDAYQDFSKARVDYDQDIEVCGKLHYFYDLTAALSPVRRAEDYSAYGPKIGPNNVTGVFGDRIDTSLGFSEIHTMLMGPMMIFHVLPVLGCKFCSKWRGGSKYRQCALFCIQQVDMANFKESNTVKYKFGSTTELSPLVKVQNRKYCKRMNDLYIGTMTIFSLTVMLFVGKILTLTYAWFARAI